MTELCFTTALACLWLTIAAGAWIMVANAIHRLLLQWEKTAAARERAALAKLLEVEDVERRVEITPLLPCMTCARRTMAC